jgi:hypothetical protein
MWNIDRVVKSRENVWNSHLLSLTPRCCGPTRVMASSCFRFLDHTQRHITIGTTPLDKWSAHHRDLYLTTHNTHNTQTSMHPVGFEPKIPAVERPQIYALGRAATGTGNMMYIKNIQCYLTPIPCIHFPILWTILLNILYSFSLPIPSIFYGFYLLTSSIVISPLFVFHRFCIIFKILLRVKFTCFVEQTAVFVSSSL